MERIWSKLGWGSKLLLTLLAETLCIVVIWLIFSFAFWDISIFLSWSSLRILVAMWLITGLIFGLFKGYECFLKTEARKENDS